MLTIREVCSVNSFLAVSVSFHDGAFEGDNQSMQQRHHQPDVTASFGTDILIGSCDMHGVKGQSEESTKFDGLPVEGSPDIVTGVAL